MMIIIKTFAIGTLINRTISINDYGGNKMIIDKSAIFLADTESLWYCDGITNNSSVTGVAILVIMIIRINYIYMCVCVCVCVCV